MALCFSFLFGIYVWGHKTISLISKNKKSVKNLEVFRLLKIMSYYIFNFIFKEVSHLQILFDSWFFSLILLLSQK